MSVYGLFQPSVMGMMSQAHSLSNIGFNIANVNTGGYKATDTQFATLVSKTLDKQSDLGGVRPVDLQRIDQQGLLLSSNSNLDLGINGRGFFMVNTELDGSGETFYTRDGSFQLATGPDTTVIADDNSTITVQEGYLVDKNGYYVQGWPRDASGNFTTTGATQALRVDPYAFTSTGTSTTTASLTANVPGEIGTGQTEVFNASMVDSAGVEHSVELTFTKTGTNEWTITPATGSALDTVNSTAGTLTFDSKGVLSSGTPYTVDITWASGATTSVTLDMTNVTQYAGAFSVFNYQRDGFPAGDMQSFSFNTDGTIVGNFDNATNQPIYQLALVTFINPNGLTMKNGNLFQVSGESGEPNVTTASVEGFATFAPNSREVSNVDIADEFTRMIITQQAYNASATTFRTADELTQVARDLKR